MGFIDFSTGDVLTANQMDTVLRQSVMRFADAAERDTAIGTAIAEGMLAYLDDTNEVLKYDGSSWIDISGDITGVTAGTALTGGGTSGNVTLDVDESALTIAQSQVTDLVSDLTDKQDDVITTQGDLVIGDASGDPVRLPVGSADQVLTSDGTTVSFQDAGGGGLGDWTLISSGAIPTGVGSVTFSSLGGQAETMIIIDGLQSNQGTNFNLTEINGSARGGSVANYDLENDEGGGIIGRVRLRDGTTFLRIAKVGSGSSNVNASIFINAGDSTGASMLQILGGSQKTNSTSEESNLSQGIVEKGGATLSSLTIDDQVGSITSGTFEIYTRGA